MKYIFITGGVVSGLGKGTLVASLGRILALQGNKVNCIKFDPYFCFDAKHLTSQEHGEAYILKDGTITDLDLGHYYRFIPGIELDSRSTNTSGKIYKKVIEDSENNLHKGKTTQLIPHVSNEIMRRFKAYEENEDPKIENFTIIEIGGTVGDMESDIYLESIKQFKRNNDCILIHLGLLPYISASNETKTKAIQHSVIQLQQRGLSPDILVCRCNKETDINTKEKLSLFCNVDIKDIIDDIDCSIYDLPQNLSKQNVLQRIYKKFNIQDIKDIDYKIEFPVKTEEINEITHTPLGTTSTISNTAISPIRIAIVSDNVENLDAYKSLLETLRLQQLRTGIPVNICFLKSELDVKDVRILTIDIDGLIIAENTNSKLKTELKELNIPMFIRTRMDTREGFPEFNTTIEHTDKIILDFIEASYEYNKQRTTKLID